MRPIRSKTAAFLVALALLAPAAASAIAAEPGPTDSTGTGAIVERNGNIWAGRRHQPTSSAVESAEQQSGETTAPQTQRSDQQVDRLLQQLIQTQRRYPPGFLERHP